MATTPPRPEPDADSPPGPFPVWPGALVGLFLAGSLIAIEVGRAVPREVSMLCGGVMSLAHALTAFAAITLLGDALVVSAWESRLAGRRERLEDATEVNPYLDARTADPAADLARVARADGQLSSGRRALRRICSVPAYASPLIGLLIAVLMNRDAVSDLEQGGPLALALAESSGVVLLGLGAARAVRTVRLGWLGVVAPGSDAASRSADG